MRIFNGAAFAVAIAGGALALTHAQAGTSAAMVLESADVVDGRPLSPDFIYPRCGGKNISPALSWRGAPAATQSFVLTFIDLDGTADYWSHWIIVDLPASVAGLTRGVSTLPEGARTILSNFGDPVYAGPCPPPGTGVHHYEFTIWAMPVPSTTIAADEKARSLRERLEHESIAHATLSASVAAK